MPLITTEAEGASLELQIQQLQQRVDKAEQKTAVLEKQLGITATTLFTKTLKVGTVNDQVKALQQFLKQFPDIYPEGLVTGCFGPLTENAVKNFQKKEGLEVVGIVGSTTIAKSMKL